MIQRKQSIWLLLAAAAAFSTLKFSFYSGNKMEESNKTFQYLTAQSNILLLILTAGTGLLALIAIFLYKNRKMQLRITLITEMVALANLAIFYVLSRKFIPAESNFDLTAILSFVVPIFLILAVIGIRKDEKLVKSLDRLR